jgi:hypothetical protein
MQGMATWEVAWPEIMGIWSDCEGKKVIRGECHFPSLSQTFKNTENAAEFPKILWDESTSYFVWIMRKMVQEDRQVAFGLYYWFFSKGLDVKNYYFYMA